MNTTRTATLSNRRRNADVWTPPTMAEAKCRRTEFVPSATLLQLLTAAEANKLTHRQRMAHQIRSWCLTTTNNRKWRAAAATTSARLRVDATYLELIDACRRGSVTLHRRSGTTVLTARRMRGANDHVFTVVADRA